jgi:hypothetical protein
MLAELSRREVEAEADLNWNERGHIISDVAMQRAAS